MPVRLCPAKPRPASAVGCSSSAEGALGQPGRACWRADAAGVAGASPFPTCCCASLTRGILRARKKYILYTACARQGLYNSTDLRPKGSTLPASARPTWSTPAGPVGPPAAGSEGPAPKKTHTRGAPRNINKQIMIISSTNDHVQQAHANSSQQPPGSAGQACLSADGGQAPAQEPGRRHGTAVCGMAEAERPHGE